ncbi:MAG TPA: nuclear transport factor 2 family protein [Cyclobacteriaceae bacterium]|nr:nuclear transport factor 2 family protein [Cyclobacteriaceae bacterium]
MKTWTLRLLATVELITRLLMVIILNPVLIGCKTNVDINNRNAPAELDSVLRIQEDAYDLNTEAGRKLLAGTCHDSLLFIGGDDGGLVQSVDFYVHDLADGYSRRPTERTYRIYEHTAIVTSIQQTFKLFNKDTIYFNARSTKVFIRDEGAWKMAYVSFAPLPVSYRHRVRVDRRLMDSYAGLYRTGENTVDTVRVFEGRLFISDGSETGSELFPVNDSTFLGDGYFGCTVFSSNRKGQVDRMYFEFPDGQRINSPKIR